MAHSAAAEVDDGILAYDKGHYAAAYKEFSSSAKRGDPAEKHLLASLYYRGHGVGKDMKKAVDLFTEAAESDHLPSLANLALMYSLGDGVQKNIKKSLEK